MAEHCRPIILAVALAGLAWPVQSHADTFVIDTDVNGPLFGTPFDDTFIFNASVSGTVFGFSGNDDFIFNDGGSADLIAGGLDSDSVSFANSTTPVTVSFDDFVNIEAIEGSALGPDSLLGTAGADGFWVSAPDAGTISGVTFSGFENLDGLSGTDSFTVNADISGTVSGGADNDAFWLGATIIGTLDGGAGFDTLVGTSAQNSFIVTGSDKGTLNGSVFQGFQNLNGGPGADTFDISAALSGTASGESGDDNFRIYDGGTVGAINGGGDVDTVSYANSTGPVTVDFGKFTEVESLIGSPSAADALEATAGADTFTIDALGTSNVNGTLDSADFEIFNGLAGDDDFVLAADISITLDGGTGFDSAFIGSSAENNLVLFNIEVVSYDNDGDGVNNNADNCIEVANPSQLDTDGDNIGNACDADVAPSFGDCVVNFLDLQVLDETFFSYGNLDTDFNGDGVVNVSDFLIMVDYFFGPPGPSGISNACSP